LSIGEAISSDSCNTEQIALFEDIKINDPGSSPGSFLDDQLTARTAAPLDRWRQIAAPLPTYPDTNKKTNQTR
jgi:hypothetical protein